MDRPVLATLSPLVLLALTTLLPAATGRCEGQPAGQPVAPLPPESPWTGKSRSLIASSTDPWVTPAEESGLTATPGYHDTIAWLRRLAEASDRVNMVSLGRSPERRDLWLVIASREGAATPEALRRNGRPTLFVQAGIHAGEIDGKDAGMMLLRDMTVGGEKTDLLDGANLLFVPIFNVDGHERRSPYSRVNQRGPVEMGWRTTSRNLNLNRDYTKLDTPEMRALVKALVTWQPDLYLDVHVTDGADYQYDITFGWTGAHGHSPAIAAWLDRSFGPAVSSELAAMGHVPGPLVFAYGGRDPANGIVNWMAPPRFSHGYGDVRHLATVLVENHSLKSYERRVLGTYVFLESTLRTLAREGKALRVASAADRARRAEMIPLSWRVPGAPQREIELLGVETRESLSPISGEVWLEWTGRPKSFQVPYYVANERAAEISRPAAYWIPPGWPELIEKLSLHGIACETFASPREIDVEMYRLVDPDVADQPYEGRVRVEATTTVERRVERFPAGSVRVSTDQPLGDLAVVLLEPSAPDSFFQWGFLLEVLTRTEYIEPYVLEPLAARMIAENPQLEREFFDRLREDAGFRGNPRARLRWFYEQTPYFDERYLLYPIAREPFSP